MRLRVCLALAIAAPLSGIALTGQSVVRTADPIKRGLEESDFSSQGPIAVRKVYEELSGKLR